TSTLALALASVTTNTVTTNVVNVSGTRNLSVTAPSLSQSVAITAQGLELLGALTGNIALTTATNSFTNLAGNLTVGSGTNTISVTNGNATVINTVNTAGVTTANQSFTLISGG